MKTSLRIVAVVVALVAGAGLTRIGAQERITLTTPIAQPPQIVGYSVSRLLLTWEPTPQIVVVLRGTDGTTTDAVYEGAAATTLLVALNKANLSTRSLLQRILDRLVADGKIVGTVVGAVP